MTNRLGRFVKQSEISATSCRCQLTKAREGSKAHGCTVRRQMTRRGSQAVRARAAPPVAVSGGGSGVRIHQQAAALQHRAGGAGVRVNRAAAAAARPLARGGKGARRVHRQGAAAAKAASRMVAGCADGARANVHLAADAALGAVGRKAGARKAVEVGVGIFELAAAAPVFIAQALHSPPAIDVAPPLPAPAPAPAPVSRPTHQWVNGQWVALTPAPAVDAHAAGAGYKPPVGYPAAQRRSGTSKRKKSSSRSGGR